MESGLKWDWEDIIQLDLAYIRYIFREWSYKSVEV